MVAMVKIRKPQHLDTVSGRQTLWKELLAFQFEKMEHVLLVGCHQKILGVELSEVHTVRVLGKTEKSFKDVQGDVIDLDAILDRLLHPAFHHCGKNWAPCWQDQLMSFDLFSFDDETNVSLWSAVENMLQSSSFLNGADGRGGITDIFVVGFGSTYSTWQIMRRSCYPKRQKTWPHAPSNAFSMRSSMANSAIATLPLFIVNQ